MWGGHASHAVAPARNVVPRPAGRSWEECAAYPLATLTAYRMLRRARLAAGQTVLFVGYGDERQVDSADQLQPADRQVFLKVSYALQP